MTCIKKHFVIDRQLTVVPFGAITYNRTARPDFPTDNINIDINGLAKRSSLFTGIRNILQATFPGTQLSNNLFKPLVYVCFSKQGNIDFEDGEVAIIANKRGLPESVLSDFKTFLTGFENITSIMPELFRYYAFLGRTTLDGIVPTVSTNYHIKWPKEDDLIQDYLTIDVFETIFRIYKRKRIDELTVTDDQKYQLGQLALLFLAIINRDEAFTFDEDEHLAVVIRYDGILDADIYYKGTILREDKVIRLRWAFFMLYIIDICISPEALTYGSETS